MKSIYEISKELNLSVSKVYKICLDNGLNKIGLIGGSKGFKMSDESKKKISDAKKLLYKNNPEKHIWKSNSKFISKPCEEFKKILDEQHIPYVAELTPLDDRFFSIDIAFPDKRIGIEINGNQHYNKDGSLKKYYNDRHNLIESYGWKLYEIHFSICYNRDEVLNLVKNILEENSTIFTFDYDNYLKEKLIKTEKNFLCKKCGENKMDRYSNQCTKCQHLSRRKVQRPSFDQLNLDIEQLGYSGTGRKYGVSDNAIRKWLKFD